VSRDSNWFRYDAAAQRLTLTLHVQPNARKSEVMGLHGEALKLKIAAPAVDNKANTALVVFLSDLLGVPKSTIAIRHGGTGRRKVVDIAGGPDLAAKLAAIAASRLTNHDSRLTPST
jgi:uncharacterized protein (TIGR00251 family)